MFECHRLPHINEYRSYAIWVNQDIVFTQVCMYKVCFFIKKAHVFDDCAKNEFRFIIFKRNVLQEGVGYFFFSHKLHDKYVFLGKYRLRDPHSCAFCTFKVLELFACPCKNYIPLVISDVCEARVLHDVGIHGFESAAGNSIYFNCQFFFRPYRIEDICFLSSTDGSTQCLYYALLGKGVKEFKGRYIEYIFFYLQSLGVLLSWHAIYL